MLTSKSTLVRSLIIVSSAIFLLLSSIYASGEVEGNKQLDGEKLYAQKCVMCHDDSVFKQKNRSATSYKQLESQVKEYNVIAMANFDNDQIKAVTDYLNERYYKFDALK